MVSLSTKLPTKCQQSIFYVDKIKMKIKKNKINEILNLFYENIKIINKNIKNSYNQFITFIN